MPNLTLLPLVNVDSVNSFNYADIWKIYQGNTYSLYLQLQDVDRPVGFTQTFTDQPRSPFYLRYMPPASSTLSITINDLNQTNVVTKVASQSFSNDLSIWSFNLSASETANMSGGNIIATFVDGNTSISYTFLVQNVLSTIPSNRSSC